MYTYDGNEKKPKLTLLMDGKELSLGTDYSYNYKDNVNVGTATITITGKGTYYGTKKVTYKINARSLPAIEKLSTSSYTYDGKVKKPAVTVKNGSITLKSGTDYSYVYKNNTNAGTASVVVTYKGNYTGTSTVNYKINPKKVTPTVTLSTTKYTYDGKVKSPAVTVKNGSTKLGTANYTTTYSKGRKDVGKHSVTVSLKGNITGTKKVDFIINPRGTTITKLTPAAKGYTVIWARQKTKMSTSVITGYEIHYSPDKQFKSGNKTVTVTGYNSASKAVGGLLAKKTYYVRIRTYKTVNKVKYYSPWSAAKTVKTK